MTQTQNLNLVLALAHNCYGTQPPTPIRASTKEENILDFKIVNVEAFSWLKYRRMEIRTLHLSKLVVTYSSAWWTPALHGILGNQENHWIWLPYICVLSFTQRPWSFGISKNLSSYLFCVIFDQKELPWAVQYLKLQACGDPTEESWEAGSSFWKFSMGAATLWNWVKHCMNYVLLL